MEENKLNLEFIEPEVKVVAVSPRRVLCMSVEIQEYKVYSFEDAEKASGN